MRRAAASALFAFVTLLSLSTIACQPVDPLTSEAAAPGSP